MLSLALIAGLISPFEWGDMKGSPSFEAGPFVVEEVRALSITRPLLQAKSVLLVDAATDEVLMEKEADTPRSIGSVTKLMSILVVLESGIDPNQMTSLAPEDIREGGVQRFLIGEPVSVKDLMAAALVASDNSAMSALARLASSDVTIPFTDRMNQKAKTLGMQSTSFVDETGLSARNRSTAEDLVFLLKAVDAKPMLRPFFTTDRWQATTGTGRAVSFLSTNELTHDQVSIAVQTAKTGYIAQAGYCLVTRSEVDGRSFWTVVLHAPTKHTRFSDTASLLFWALDPTSFYGK